MGKKKKKRAKTERRGRRPATEKAPVFPCRGGVRRRSRGTGMKRGRGALAGQRKTPTVIQVKNHRLRLWGKKTGERKGRALSSGKDARPARQKEAIFFSAQSEEKGGGGRKARLQSLRPHCIWGKKEKGGFCNTLRKICWGGGRPGVPSVKMLSWSEQERGRIQLDRLGSGGEKGEDAIVVVERKIEVPWKEARR